MRIGLLGYALCAWTDAASAEAAIAIAAPSRMRRKRTRISGLERVGEAQGNHRVVLEAVKAVVELGLLGRRVVLQVGAGSRTLNRSAAGHVDLGLGAALGHDAQVEYQRQAAVDGAPVADAEVGRRPVEIHLGVERADIRSVVN